MKSGLHLTNYCADVRRIPQTVLPDAEGTDAYCGEKSPRPSVALPISTNLCLPKLSASLWNMATSGTAVPKAPIDEHCKPLSSEVEIRFSTDRWRAKHPALDPGPDKCHLKGKLRRLVTFAANCRHGSSALGRHIRKPAVFKFGFEESFHLGYERENGVDQ
jgi:hypothetical protein